ncbi:hypothetical protein [Fibrobacter sp. UWB11]|uniref:hypothetical protein n=1 Tax=Fibrobacter sp. UWB11 TaxID=1896202 RepID=UPI0020C99EDC|nr:hypothetical protein [Fibrobacter sp. UWB11]
MLFLNVYAEAKSSGSARSRSQTKKEKTTVVEKKTAPKSVDKSKSMDKSKQATPISTTSVSSNYETIAELEKDDVVRDTVVDTVYVVMPEKTTPVAKEECNVPLPHQSAFLGQGLSVGIGAGLFNASKDCDCLGVWQGQLEYHYKEYITGGFDVRFFGGTLDRDVMLMYQRYRLNVRFHRGFTGADFYISPMFGLETTDLSEFRNELRDGVKKDESSDGESSSDDDSDSLQIEKNCEKMFSLDGFTFGVEAGMGLVIFRYLGLSAAASYEFNLSWAQLVSFSPGVAFNLREAWPWAGKNLRSTWVSFEMIFQRYFNRGVKEWAVAGFIGLQFGI